MIVLAKLTFVGCMALMTMSFVAAHAIAEDASTAPGTKIDLPTVLRLAGANNLDVRLARERLAEAQANQLIAVQQFFPSVSPGANYRRHDGRIQDVAGAIIDADKEAYVTGVTATAQVDVGDAIFRTLAARQMVQAGRYAATVQQQESVLLAALAYFDLAKARGANSVANEALAIAQNYQQQITQAVEAGLAFRGDLFRATIQVERNRLLVTQMREQQRLAAARLAQLLHLDATVQLTPAGGELAPLRLIAAEQSLDGLVIQALAARPELKQYAAQLEAARKSRQGAIYGPLIPTLGGQVFYGGLGGGVGSPGPQSFGPSSDYSAGLSWRIGPGGLFDQGRIKANSARVRAGTLELEKVRDEVIRQVVDGHTRTHSLAVQITDAQRALAAAEQTLRLAQERREFAVGVVLETIQSEQELTRARLDFLNAVAEHNKAQFQLSRACGGITPELSPMQTLEHSLKRTSPR